MSHQLPGAIDRRTLVDSLRHIITAAGAIPPGALHRRAAQPAGIALELLFDDVAEANLNAPRLADAKAATDIPPTRIYVLSGATLGVPALPAWQDLACDAAAFHAIAGEAGLHAAYPFRPQEWLTLDIAAGVGVQLARAPSDLPDWFAGAPLRQHLHWLLRARGQRIAHAASLGRDGRGVVLLGHGGAGKSGTTLAGLAAGLQTVGDDYIALGGLEPAIMRPLFRIVKQDRGGLARIAGLTEQLADAPENWKGKVEFDPTARFPGCFADSLSVGAIILPQVAHAPVPRLLPAGAGEAMRVLMRSNLYQFPGEPEDGLDYYGALVRSLPIYRLELSAHAVDNGTAIAELVAKLV